MLTLEQVMNSLSPEARASFSTAFASLRDRQLVVVAQPDPFTLTWNAEMSKLARTVARDLGSPLRRLRVDGGLTRSRTLLQAQADLLQAPVELYPSPHATALGVAALARLGASAATSPTNAVCPWVPAAVFEPHIRSTEAEARLHAWRRAAEATMDLTL